MISFLLNSEWHQTSTTEPMAITSITNAHKLDYYYLSQPMIINKNICEYMSIASVLITFLLLSRSPAYLRACHFFSNRQSTNCTRYPINHGTIATLHISYARVPSPNNSQLCNWLMKFYKMIIFSPQVANLNNKFDSIVVNAISVYKRIAYCTEIAFAVCCEEDRDTRRRERWSRRVIKCWYIIILGL